MAGTYIDMITRIQDDLVNSSLTVAQIKNAITSTIADYENEQFFFNQKTATFSTVANQEYYGTADLADIPNIVSIFSMLVTTNGIKLPVQAIDFDQMDFEQNSTAISLPYWHAYYGQQIRLYPIPDQVYTITLSYLYKFAALVNNADTNAWMTEGEEMIRQASKRRLALDILYDDALAMRCKSLEDEVYDGLKRETAQRLPNKTLRIPAMAAAKRFNIFAGY